MSGRSALATPPRPRAEKTSVGKLPTTPRRLATDADQSRSCAADALPPPAQGHSGVRRTRRQAIGLLADRGHRWSNLVSPRCRPPHGVDRKCLTYESRSITSSALSHSPRPSGVRAEIRLPSTRRVVDPVGASVLHISSRSKAGSPTVFVHTSTSDPAFHVSVLVERVLGRVGTTIAVLLQRQRGTQAWWSLLKLDSASTVAVLRCSTGDSSLPKRCPTARQRPRHAGLCAAANLDPVIQDLSVGFAARGFGILPVTLR